jgi:hypothetical protein
MRSYIFTKREIERLLAWLRTGEEDDGTRMLLSRIRRNWPTLRDDIQLFLLAVKKMRALGRGDRRPRLKEVLGSEVAGKAKALSELARKARAQLEADKGRDLGGVADE